jgi:hypothetical protein
MSVSTTTVTSFTIQHPLVLETLVRMGGHQLCRLLHHRIPHLPLSAAICSRLAELSFEVVPGEHQTPQALSAMQKADAEKWLPLIKEFGIRPSNPQCPLRAPRTVVVPKFSSTCFFCCMARARSPFYRPFHRSGLRRTLAPTMPSADFCAAVRPPPDSLSPNRGHSADLPR